MSVSVLLPNATHTTGEGPYWDNENKELLFVDIIAGNVHKWNSKTNNLSMHHVGNAASVIVPRTSGGYLVGSERKLLQLDWETGECKTITEIEKGTNNRFNDGKCDLSGRLWVGTMGAEKVPSVPEIEKGALYSLNGSNLQQHIDKISISNGIDWSSDAKTMYFIDSYARKVYGFDFDLENGEIKNQRTAIDFNKWSVEELGFPDGCCIDNEDKLWVACYNGGRVVRFDPKTGEEITHVKFPVKRITSCCFGGSDYSELFVTSGKLGLTDEEFTNEQPLAGSVFKVTDLGVKGVPPRPCKD